MKKMPRFSTTCHLFIPAWFLLVCSTFLCNAYEDFVIKDCLPSTLSHCNKSLTTGQWPNRAWNLEVTAGTNLLQETVFFLKWDYDFENLRCLQFLIKSVGFPDMCRILDYTDGPNWRFRMEMPLNVSNRNYTIELYSLPQGNAPEPIVTKSNISIFQCNEWKVNFTHEYDGEQLVVTLEKGPRRCDFKSYSVSIYDEKKNEIYSKDIDETKASTKLRVVSDEQLCQGNYYIEVSPKIPCKAFDETRTRGCRYSWSTVEEYIPRVPCDKDKTRNKRSPRIPETNDRLTTIIVVIGVLAGILTILLGIYYLKSIQLKPKNRGILLFADDHMAHIDAVKRLSDYLRECHLDVNLASHFLKHNDDNNQLVILMEILTVDFVLLVVSSALQKRMEAWDKDQDYIEFFKEKNSNILTKQFLEKLILWNKLYACRFDNVKEFEPRFEKSYPVPSQLDELVEVLETPGYNFSSLKYFKKRILFNLLKVAVEKVADYERSNSGWFLRKYFCPRVIVATTEENRILGHT